MGLAGETWLMDVWSVVLPARICGRSVLTVVVVVVCYCWARRYWFEGLLLPPPLVMGESVVWLICFWLVSLFMLKLVPLRFLVAEYDDVEFF